jgi:hypothetical protein
MWNFLEKCDIIFEQFHPSAWLADQRVSLCAATFATAGLRLVRCDAACTLCIMQTNSRLHVSDFRWPSASSRRVCSALSHMQMREWYYTKGEFSKCHSARKLWEILCFERVLHSSPRPPRADWRDAIANPIKTHDSVFTACRSFLAWGLIVFAALLLLISSGPPRLLLVFRSRNLIKAAVSLSDFGPRQLINLFVFFFAAVH